MFMNHLHLFGLIFSFLFYMFLSKFYSITYTLFKIFLFISLAINFQFSLILDMFFNFLKLIILNHTYFRSSSCKNLTFSTNYNIFDVLGLIFSLIFWFSNSNNAILSFILSISCYCVWNLCCNSFFDSSY